MREDTLCDTHDMLGCRCSKAKKLPPHLRGKVSIGELDQYEHYDTLENIKVRPPPLIFFIFYFYCILLTCLAE